LIIMKGDVVCKLNKTLTEKKNNGERVMIGKCLLASYIICSARQNISLSIKTGNHFFQFLEVNDV
jgi:hypothetical protein